MATINKIQDVINSAAKIQNFEQMVDWYLAIGIIWQVGVGAGVLGITVLFWVLIHNIFFMHS